MKKLFVAIVLAGLVEGCAWLTDGDRGANSGGTTARGTSEVSTGANAGMDRGVTGSESVPPP